MSVDEVMMTERQMKGKCQKPLDSKCNITAEGGTLLRSLLKSLAERHSQVCSSLSNQKSSILRRKWLCGVGAPSGTGGGSG